MPEKAALIYIGVGIVVLWLLTTAFRPARKTQAPPPRFEPVAEPPTPRPPLTAPVIVAAPPDDFDEGPPAERRRIQLPAGPTADVTAKDPAAMAAFLRQWPLLREAISASVVDLRSNYLGEPIGSDVHADAFDEVDMAEVYCASEDSFVVSLRFGWQHPDDPHISTFEIEEGRIELTVDG